MNVDIGGCQCCGSGDVNSLLYNSAGFCYNKKIKMLFWPPFYVGDAEKE